MEKHLNIISVDDALQKYFDLFPNSHLTKVQIEYVGPFLKYEIVGQDKNKRHLLEFNARTQEILKQHSRPLKPKEMDNERLNRRVLNIENLMPLEEVTNIALEIVEVDHPYQWELDRKKDRTVWKIEIADQTGSEFHEVKVDAQEGTVTHYKLKS